MSLDAAPAGSMSAADIHADAASPQNRHVASVSGKDIEVSRILSARDAELYRAAFTAQQISDWDLADRAVTEIKDKSLVGHVLADRYARRGLTLAEAKTWMQANANLPEADSIYEQAKHLQGFAAAGIAKPIEASASWNGSTGNETPFGFRSTAADDGAKKTPSLRKINTALRRNDPITARALLATEMQRGKISSTQAGEITGRIAAAFFYDGETERARPMAHTAAEAGRPLGLWIEGLSAWKQKDYVASTRSFASLAQAPGLSAWDRSAAAYWAYRSAKHINDSTQAHHWLTEAAKYPRSFYGYMAASTLSTSVDNSWKLPEFNARDAQLIAQNPDGLQALALVQVGRSDLAENELRRIPLIGHRDLQTAMLALAEKAHMPSLTLQLSGIATNDNGRTYDAAQYPVPPWQPTGGFKVDRALIYALMKRESEFDPEAVSDSGACGLMQIMPSTARGIANDNEIDKGHDCPDRLFDPATNMEMGQKYVRVLAGQPMIGDNLLLLLAAYNGGPGNLARWMDGEDRADPLLFMESLPLRETHDYVQQVLMHYWMYRSRLAEPQTSVAQLARGEWPRYALNDSKVPAPIQHAAASPLLKLASAAK